MEGLALPGLERLVAGWIAVVYPDQPPGAFHIEGDHLVCIRDDMAGAIQHPHREMHHILPGTLYGNKGSMLPDVQWFYHSPEYQWHRDLKARLESWNQSVGQANLVERLWFRDWQWYCGNGGGT